MATVIAPQVWHLGLGIMPLMPELSPLLLELSNLIEEAGRLAVESRQSLVSELKADGSIVTNGDRAVETWLRPRLTQLAPSSEVWGEELGWSAPGPGGLWVVDPIDGTSNYSYGNPLWGVSAALLVGGKITMGAIALPDLNEIYLSEVGAGAYLNGKPLPMIPAGEIKRHQLVSAFDGAMDRIGRNQFPGKMRTIGSFVLEGAFVATQRLRGMICCREKLYDVGAVVLINRELGADVRYADGSPFVEANLMAEGPITQPWIVFPKDSGFSLVG